MPVPTAVPSKQPTQAPTDQPSTQPTTQPTQAPTGQPSVAGGTNQPSKQPTQAPTNQPSSAPTGPIANCTGNYGTTGIAGCEYQPCQDNEYEEFYQNTAADCYAVCESGWIPTTPGEPFGGAFAPNPDPIDPQDPNPYICYCYATLTAMNNLAIAGGVTLLATGEIFPLGCG